MLFAVHISDGILTAPWLVGGFCIAGLLWMLGAFRIRDEEIPRTALITAVIFISSSIHVPIGRTSVHLLANGLAGVVLGRRAVLAIAIGLLLQVLLLQHGGFYTLGINTCILTLPALVCWCAFRVLHKTRWIYLPSLRFALVALGVGGWLLLVVFSGALLVSNIGNTLDQFELGTATSLTLHPATLGVCLVMSLVFARFENKLENLPEFPLGLLLGELTVFLTVGLNCMVLLLGGVTNWTGGPLILLVLHLPVAVVEGVIMGVTLGFLMRVKPEILGVKPHLPATCEEKPADMAPPHRQHENQAVR